MSKKKTDISHNLREEESMITPMQALNELSFGDMEDSILENCIFTYSNPCNLEYKQCYK